MTYARSNKSQSCSSRSQFGSWATKLLLLSLVPALLAAQLSAQESDPGDPPGAIARISYLNGGVSLQASGSDEWSQAPVNYPMIGGDRLYTGPGSRAVVQLGGAEVRVWQLTDVSLVNQSDNFQQIGLASGNLRLRVFQMEPGSQIEVDTPNGAVLVETPGDYRIEAFPQNGSSILTVNNGNAQVTGPGINQPVASGYSIGLFGNNPVEIQYLDVPDYDDLDYWSYDLDQRLQNSISARYVSRQMVGYGDLDANGTWNPQTDYGPVWYPNNVPEGWRPYSTGHWAYVQPWGYTWVDDAPWGFAPFHYGRWAVIEGRWGWTPGPPQIRPVYSPALVAFVGGGPGGGGLSIGISIGGGGGGIAAWFPIGVGEPYVPWYRCSPHYALQVNVSNVNLAVIRNPTIVNNYNTYINKTVITNTTINNRTVNNTVINNTTVNNFNYSNRTQVTAVPAAAMSSGTSVARQAVQLSPQQRQQIATAPISVRPTVPIPTAPHPSLAAAPQNVARPAPARPVLMTPNGPARATPAATKAQPVVIAKLAPPRVVPKNAAPAPVAPKPIPAPANRPAPGSAPVRTTPAEVRPAAKPAAARPATPQVTSPSAPAAVAPRQPAPKEAAPKEAEPDSRPGPAPVTRQTPVTRPAVQPETKEAPKATTPAEKTVPAPATKPRPSSRPAQQAPANQDHPTPIKPKPPAPAETPQSTPAVKPQTPAAGQKTAPKPASNQTKKPASKPDDKPDPPKKEEPKPDPQD